MTAGDKTYIGAGSLPARGAWIEIISREYDKPYISRSPQGERGLKSEDLVAYKGS